MMSLLVKAFLQDFLPQWNAKITAIRAYASLPLRSLCSFVATPNLVQSGLIKVRSSPIKPNQGIFMIPNSSPAAFPDSTAAPVKPPRPDNALELEHHPVNHRRGENPWQTRCAIHT